MSDATNTRPQGAVTVLVTRRVKPGHAQAFEQAMRHMVAAASEFAGHLGGHLIAPGSDTSDTHNPCESNLWHVIFAFDSPEHLQRWQQSPARALGLAAVAPHTEGEQQVRQVAGLGYWFAEPKGPAQTPPPRWKVALVTWLGICPAVYVLFLLLGEALAAWPLLPRVMLITALVVLLMTWVIAPRLTAWFKPWLHPVSQGQPT
jgi:antibiotic biosynthesis monooxygenase (ABM) superfamily enzyme